MALVYADRVQETSTTTGTGTYDLAGAVAGFQTFVAGVATTNTCYYCATDGVDWEVGVGTVTDATPDTLARTSILASSNAGAAVNWAAGTRNIFVTIPGSMVATAAEQEAATAEGKFVTPAVQHRHPSAAKFWVKATGNSTTIVVSYNMTSWADTGLGDADGTIATDFSGADWCLLCGVIENAGSSNGVCPISNAQAAGTFGLILQNLDDGASVDWLTNEDPTAWFACGFGDQA